MGWYPVGCHPIFRVHITDSSKNTGLFIEQNFINRCYLPICAHQLVIHLQCHHCMNNHLQKVCSQVRHDKELLELLPNKIIITMRITRHLLFLFIVCVGLGTVTAQSHKIEFTEYELDNGLNVILHEDHSTPIVAISVLYHVGSKNEAPQRTGFAHFFEHLMFEGSANVDRGEFDSYIERAGGQLNAYTTQDRTFYFEVLPSNQLELGLWLESERMLHAKVDQIGIETQREVVKEERRQRYENQPYGTILLEAMKRAYEKHPYQWTPIGSMEDLNAASEEDYQQFYEDFYVPNNATLSIAGDISIPEAKRMIDKYFSTIPEGEPIDRPDIEEPALSGEIRDTVYDNIQLPAVIHTYRIPAINTEDYYAVDMLSRLMARGQSSRLYKALVDEKQLAVTANSIPLSLEDPGVALAFAIANAGVDPAELEAAMDAEFEKVQKELISTQEFQKLRNQIETEFITSNASVRGIAESLAVYETHYGDANLINTEIERYMEVTREDIRRVAQEYFTPDNRVVLYYLSKPAP